MGRPWRALSGGGAGLFRSLLPRLTYEIRSELRRRRSHYGTVKTRIAYTPRDYLGIAYIPCHVILLFVH